MNITTIFFDIDNTLFNYTKAEKKAISLIQQKHFPKFQEDTFYHKWIIESKKYWALFEANKMSFEQHSTMRVVTTWQFLGKNLTEEEAEKISQEYIKLYESSWEASPHVIPVLKVLRQRKIRVGVITNGNKEQQLKKLHHIGVVKYIDQDLIVISENIKYSKPQKEIFLHAQKVAKATPEQLLIVGDNYLVDIEPAKLLQWNTLHINYEAPSQETSNDFRKILTIIDNKHKL